MKSVLMFVFGALFASGWWAAFVFEGEFMFVLVATLVVVSALIAIRFVTFLLDNWNNL